MYSHRSGLPDHAGDLLEDLGYDRRYILDHLRDLPLGPFRTAYAYTNFGLTAGAEAVATSAGKTWEDLSQEALYGPLGMTSTSSRFDEYEARPDRAIGHIHVDGAYKPLYVRDAQAEAPAGGVSSTANDMTKWLTMVLANGTYGGKTIVDPKQLLAAVTPQIVASPPSEPAARPAFYGYGFNVGTTAAARTQFSHSGAFELGAGTNFVIIPSADVAIVALTNATPSGVPETLTAEFADLVQFGEVRQDWRKLYGDAFAAMETPAGSLAGQKPPATPAPAPPDAVTGGHLRQPLLGTGHRHRGRRKAHPRTGSAREARPRALGRQRVHLRPAGRERAARIDLQGHLLRRQAEPRVLRRGEDGHVQPLSKVRPWDFWTR